VDTPERLLDLRGLLDDLLRDGRVQQRDAEDILITPRTKRQLHLHPLELIAERELPDPERPDKTLDLDALTHWLCEQCGQPYYRIDPLKVNVGRSTGVMSYAFAQRHNILAVEVTEDHVVIASAQPYMRQWESMLTQVLQGREIRRVVTNPADLSRYMLEFYTMARSVAKAEDQGLEVSAISNFEQMLELGSSRIAGGQRQPISSTSSTGCCSTHLTSAPAIYTLSRAAKKGQCAVSHRRRAASCL
jgi:general secretion pathway protein E